MKQIRMFWARLLGMFSRSRRERELSEELESNLQLHIDDNLARGMSPEEARRQALIRLGGVEPTKELYREQRGLPFLERSVADVRYALRILGKNPGYATVAVLTLALGIGSSTAVFTVANAVMLRRMPYPDADRIVLMWGSDGRGANRGQVSFTDTEDVRRRNHSFAAISNFADWTPTLSGEGEPERLTATQVSDGFFEVIGIQPALGRAFTSEEHIDGKDRVVILSHELWKQRFHSDPNILGKAVTLSSVPHIIVGVMPEGLEPLPTTLVQGGQLYRPIGETYDNTQRRAEHLRSIARLKPGVTVAQAQADVDSIARAMESEFPKEDANLHFKIATLLADTGHELRPSLIVLFCAALVLLLIACANVAGLLIARGTSRQKEFALRTALGATRARIIRQGLTESFVLAGLGGVFGLGIAYASTFLAARLAPKLGSPLTHATIDPKVVAFAAAAVLLTSVLFGLAPALQSAVSNLALALKQGGQSAEVSRGGRRLHGAVIVGELALALVMLSVAGLLIRGFVRLQRVEIGFQARNLLVMHVWVPNSKYKEPARQIAFYQELLRRVKALPGVQAAAIVHNPPLLDYDGRGILPEGRADVPQNYLSPQAYFVSTDYLSTMGIPLLQGRGFTDADKEAGDFVAMVSESFAAKTWPGENAIGKRFHMLSGEKENGQWKQRTVVGVVSDIRHLGPEERVMPAIYLPYRQMPVTWMSLIVRSPQAMAQITPIRQVVSSMEPEMAVFRIGKFEDFLADAVLIRRTAMLLIVVFGSMALFLAGVGLYGLVAFVVSRRMREFGVRAALGARPADLLRLVLGSGLRLVALGTLLGVAASLAAVRVVASLLSGVGSADPAAMTSAAVLLVTIGALASIVPARRAAHADPVETLRGE